MDHVFKVKSPDSVGDSVKEQETDLSSEYCGDRGKNPGGKTGPWKDVCDEDSNSTDGWTLAGMHRVYCGLRDADLESESGRQSTSIDLPI